MENQDFLFSAHPNLQGDMWEVIFFFFQAQPKPQLSWAELTLFSIKRATAARIGHYKGEMGDGIWRHILRPEAHF